MRVTVVGAGNMGLALVAYLGVKNKCKVTLLTSKTILKQGSLVMEDVESNNIVSTTNFTVVSSSKEAFQNSDVILCTYPAFMRKKFIQENEKYIEPGTKLGFIPGYGGIEYSCTDLIKKGVIIFGLQRVPYVARARKTEDGIVSGILSKKKMLYSAAIPYHNSQMISDLLGELLDIPCLTLKEYLSITLAPSNPLLHISGLYNIFKDYRKGKYYEEEMHFYEQWNDETSELLLRYDNELQAICKRLTPLDMSEVLPLSIYYESPTAEMMTKKLQSIESFKTVMVPLKNTEDGYVPDLQSRMFIEDFPYGVCVIKSFAQMLEVDTPIIDMLLDFYERLSGYSYFKKDGTLGCDANKTGIPNLYGLNTKNKIINFYHGTIL